MRLYLTVTAAILTAFTILGLAFAAFWFVVFAHLFGGGAEPETLPETTAIESASLAPVEIPRTAETVTPSAASAHGTIAPPRRNDFDEEWARALEEASDSDSDSDEERGDYPESDDDDGDRADVGDSWDTPEDESMGE